MHENMKTSMWHTGRSERTWRLPACLLCSRHRISLAYARSERKTAYNRSLTFARIQGRMPPKGSW